MSHSFHSENRIRFERSLNLKFCDLTDSASSSTECAKMLDLKSSPVTCLTLSNFYWFPIIEFKVFLTHAIFTNRLFYFKIHFWSFTFRACMFSIVFKIIWFHFWIEFAISFKWNVEDWIIFLSRNILIVKLCLIRHQVNE